MNINEENLLGFREALGGAMLADSEAGKYRECDTEHVTFDATEYGGVHSEVEMYVHKVKGKEDKN